MYDFTWWTNAHNGNEEAAKAGRRNPIARFAEQGLTALEFPSWHAMTRWEQKSGVGSAQVKHIGARLGDSIDFRALDSSLQTTAMAQRVGAFADDSAAGAADGFEAREMPFLPP